MVVENTVMLFEPGICFGWGYSHVFRTGYALSIKIQACFPDGIRVIHQNTNVFSERDTRYPSKYERVFRTGYTLSIKIRPCFPNQVKA